MEGLRVRLAVALVDWVTWAVLTLVPRGTPPPVGKWSVRLDDEPDTVVTLIFVPYPDKPHGYHIVTHYRWDEDAPPMVVDGGTKAHLHPVSSKLTVDRLARAYKASHVVEVHTREDYDPESRPQPPGSIGPISCATLGKQLLGYNDPTLMTPPQLLDLLWRSRDDNQP